MNAQITKTNVDIGVKDPIKEIIIDKIKIVKDNNKKNVITLAKAQKNETVVPDDDIVKNYKKDMSFMIDDLEVVVLNKKEYYRLGELFGKYPLFFKKYKSEINYIKKEKINKYLLTSFKNDEWKITKKLS